MLDAVCMSVCLVVDQSREKMLISLCSKCYFLHNRSDQLSKMSLESPSMEEVPPIYANAIDNGKTLSRITQRNKHVA